MKPGRGTSVGGLLLRAFQQNAAGVTPLPTSAGQETSDRIRTGAPSPDPPYLPGGGMLSNAPGGWTARKAPLGANAQGGNQGVRQAS